MSDNLKEKNRINFTSVTGAIEVVDNNSNHTPTGTPTGATFRITPEAINKESNNSLASKVDQVVPNLLDLGDSDKLTIEVVTSSGTSEITVGIKQKKGKYHIFCGTADSTISVPLPRRLEKRNKFGEYGNLQRAFYILIVCYLKFPFQPGTIEEGGFRKLFRKLKNFYVFKWKN